MGLAPASASLFPAQYCWHSLPQKLILGFLSLQNIQSSLKGWETEAGK